MNGILDCKIGTVREYTPEDLITDQIPVNYDPQADCPEICKFIETLTPDEDDRKTLLDIIASGAYRQALFYIAFLIGHGSSGSTKFTELIQAFYGDATTEAIPLNELAKERFALANLRHARYSFGQEISEFKKVGTEVIKAISGGDYVSGDVKNQGRARFRGWTKLIFKGNSIPRFTDTTFGFRRRFIEVILPYKFVPIVDPTEPNQRKEDPDILSKITSPSELSGLLNLIIARLPEIIKNRRIHRKEGSYEAMKEQVDSVSTFLERFCLYEQTSYYDKGDFKTKISIKNLYANFEKWAELIKGNLVEVRQFGRYVRKFCENRSALDTRIDGEHATVYPGLYFNDVYFNLETNRFKLLLEAGSNPFKPEGSRKEAGLEKSLQIEKAGLAGLNDDITSNVCVYTEKEKYANLSGLSGFQDASVDLPVKNHPAQSGSLNPAGDGSLQGELSIGDERAKQKADRDRALADKYTKKPKRGAHPVIIRITQEIEAFVSVDLLHPEKEFVYGPFKPGDVATIPSCNAVGLIDKDVCVPVEES